MVDLALNVVASGEDYRAAPTPFRHQPCFQKSLLKVYPDRNLRQFSSQPEARRRLNHGAGLSRQTDRIVRALFYQRKNLITSRLPLIYLGICFFADIKE